MSEPNTALRAARTALHLSQEELARAVRREGQLAGEPNDCNKRLVQRWEAGIVTTPRGTYARALEAVTGLPVERLGFGLAEDTRGTGPGLLEAVPQSLSAEVLSGAWVTSYCFSDPPKHHADIAHVEATSSRRVWITNYPPAPKTEGHAVPFLNEIDALLANRHLIGMWKNTNDARYFGAIHLSVMPGETAMEGWFTNFVDDVHVGTGFWKWVRIGPAGLESADLAALTLRDPGEIYKLLDEHTQYDPPMTISDLGEVA
jgi:transcriptional regulator with XRE-family HTH domain